jgi:hypothetical protein
LLCWRSERIRWTTTRPHMTEEATVPEQPFAPIALDEEGNPVVCCEKCGSVNLELDGWDIDKCRDCGHWRYRDEGDRA